MILLILWYNTSRKRQVLTSHSSFPLAACGPELRAVGGSRDIHTRERGHRAMTTSVTVATRATVKRLTDNNRDLRAVYNQDLHRLSLFLTVTSGTTFEAWQRESLQLRREATQRQSTVIPSIWTADPSAPTLETTPTIAIRYAPEIRAFLPMINSCIWRQSHFAAARAEAVSAASEATLYLQRHNRFPTGKALTDFSGMIFYDDRGNQDTGIADLLSAINGL